MSKRIPILLGATLFGAAALALAAQAQVPDFPNHNIKIIVGFGPGGLGDMVTRAVADKLSKDLGKPVVVENMPGAGGISAAAAAAKAAPDGHTLLLVSGQNAAQPFLFKSLPYDPVADFTPVSQVGIFDFVIVVGKDSPFKTFADMMAAAKRDPERFNIGTISSGSAQNLAAHLFRSMAGWTSPTIPFRTTGEVVTALMSGEIQVGFETLPGVMGQIQGGSLRALAIAADAPLASLPGVPTIAASGMPDYRVVSWNGYFAPAKTPKPIVDLLNKAIAKAVTEPDVRKRFADFGVTPKTNTPEEMRAVFAADMTRWKQVIADARIAPQ